MLRSGDDISYSTALMFDSEEIVKKSCVFVERVRIEIREKVQTSLQINTSAIPVSEVEAFA